VYKQNLFGNCRGQRINTVKIFPTGIYAGMPLKHQPINHLRKTKKQKKKKKKKKKKPLTAAATAASPRAGSI